MFHQEADGVAAFSTAKTFIDLFGWRYRKRWRFLVMKRTLAKIIYTTLLQTHKAADDLYNIDARKDLLYGLLAYQLIIRLTEFFLKSCQGRKDKNWRYTLL